MKEKKVQIMGHESLPSSSSDLTPLLSASSYIRFTPGIPTEDGWYVVKVKYRNMEIYDTIHILNGDWDMDGNILSHAKLPEL